MDKHEIEKRGMVQRMLMRFGLLSSIDSYELANDIVSAINLYEDECKQMGVNNHGSASTPSVSD